MATHALRIPIDHGQFFVEDESLFSPSGWDLDQTYAILDRDHLAPKPGGLVVATDCHWGEVPVTVEVRDDRPTDRLDQWDHAAEASLLVDSGNVSLYAPEMTAGDAVPRVAVAPGPYRVLVLYGGLDTVSGDDAGEGQEHYRVVLWPEEVGEPVVHKRGFWCCREGRHAEAGWRPAALIRRIDTAG